jgi:transcriptional regulator with XRE-family HTH domain
MQEFQEKIYRTIAKNMRRIREKMGLSQEKFAELADVERESVTKIENAYKHNRPGLKILIKIAYKLKIKIGEFFVE